MEKISRTQKKKQALSAQDLGDKLVALSDDQIARLGLPEEVLTAVALAKTIKKHGGRKRQMQYIGGLMRKIDTAPIAEAVRNIEEGNQRQADLHKKAERWRDDLQRGSDSLLDELLRILPEADREQLTELVAKARRELSGTGSSPAPSRALYRFLYRYVQSLQQV